MTSPAQRRQHEQLRRTNAGRNTGNQHAPSGMRQYKRASQPQAHKGELGLTVDENGRAMIARDGRGGVPPSDWEIMLLARVAELERCNRVLSVENAVLRASLEKR